MPWPKKIAVATDGYFQPGILLQAWFFIQDQDATQVTFRMRRAEFHAKGDIIPDLVSYALMIDAAKVLEFQNQDLPVNEGPEDETVTVKQPPQNSFVSVLQDLYITYKSPYVDASVGQFKIPVSWEGYNSSAKILFAERAPVSRQYGDKRDMGIRLAKTFDKFGYSAGIFNGTEANNLDNNDAKDLALRLEVYPIEGMTVAGVVYGSVGKRADGTTKTRYEGDFIFERGPFRFQSEYIYAHTNSGSSDQNGHGFYAAAAWTFAELIQPALRGGFLNPDIGNEDDGFWHLDAGVNILIRKLEARFMLDYEHQEPESGSATELVWLAAQVYY